MTTRCKLAVVLLVAAVVTPTNARADGGPYGKGLAMKLIEISPDRSLPIVSDPGDYVVGIQRGATKDAALRAGMLRSRLRNLGGWMAFRTPAGQNKDIDDRSIDFMTNDPATLRRDAGRIFKAMGCFPSNPLGYSAVLIDTVGVGIFSRIVFVHNPFLGIVVLTRDAENREYRYLGHVGGPMIPLGEVREHGLGEHQAYVFLQNTEWGDMEAWHPTRPQVMIFDEEGAVALGGAGKRLRTDAVRVEGRTLVLERKTTAFDGPPFPGKSVIFCPHGEAQYGVLDPETHDVTVFQSQLGVEYVGGKLQPVSLALRLMAPSRSRGVGQNCETFTSVEEIRKRESFGVGRWNDDHTKWTYGGTADGYIAGSREFSSYYWSRLYTLLQGTFSVRVEVDPQLRTKLDAFWGACGRCPYKTPPPWGLGDQEAFSFLRLLQAGVTSKGKSCPPQETALVPGVRQGKPGGGGRHWCQALGSWEVGAGIGTS